MVCRHFAVSAEIRELRVVLNRLRCHEAGLMQCDPQQQHSPLHVRTTNSGVNAGEATIVFNRCAAITKNPDRVLRYHKSSRFVIELTRRCARLVPVHQRHDIVVKFVSAFLQPNRLLS